MSKAHENGKHPPDGVASKEKGSVKRRRVSNSHATDAETNQQATSSTRASATRDSESAADDESIVCSDDWRHRLEELKSCCPRSQPSGEDFSQIDDTELLSLVQRAASSQEEADWQPFASYNRSVSDKLRMRPISLVIKQLNAPECVDLLRRCIRRYPSHPKEQHFCGIWILQVLQHRRSLLFGSQEIVEVLKDFLRHLETESSADPWTSQALACLGSWRLAAGLAQKQRRHRENISSSQVGGAEADESASEDASDDDDGRANDVDSDED